MADLKTLTLLSYIICSQRVYISFYLIATGIFHYINVFSDDLLFAAISVRIIGGKKDV